MSITFEQVSYAYTDPERHKKQYRREQKHQRKKATIEPADSSLPEKAAWGTSPHAVWALKDISFSLQNGECLGIAGHTGSGKSTLIQHMNGLIHPSRGRVLIDGKNLADKKVARAYRGRIGMVFQYPEHQLFAATVYDDIAFGPRNLQFSPEEITDCVKQAMSYVGLDFDALQGKSPFELSGGQQRRVAFAGVLAMRPNVLILDEPVAGLDPKARADFLNLIDGLHAQGLTIVMVSHNMDDLASLCDRILVLCEGTLFTLGTPAEVFRRAEELRAFGLDAPAAQNFATLLQSCGFNLPLPLYDPTSLAHDIASLYQKKSSSTRTSSSPTKPQVALLNPNEENSAIAAPSESEESHA